MSQRLSIARVLHTIEGVRVKPHLPQTPMMHVYLPLTAEQALDAAADIARDESVCLFRKIADAEVPGFSRLEIPVGDAVAELTDEEIRRFFVRLVR